MKQYMIYGKMGSMKKMKPLSGDRFVGNLIHAEVFTVSSEEDERKLQKELGFLNTQGTFELREIK